MSLKLFFYLISQLTIPVPSINYFYYLQYILLMHLLDVGFVGCWLCISLIMISSFKQYVCSNNPLTIIVMQIIYEKIKLESTQIEKDVHTK